MLPAGTPADWTPLMISRTISGDEQQAGAPDGLILMPTISEGSTNFAQAAATERSPVNSFIPRSIMSRTTGCETRLRTMEFESVTSTTRPGNNPGIPSADLAGFGPWTTSIGGGWQGHVAEGSGIDAIKEQAGASHTTGFDERPPIHKV